MYCTSYALFHWNWYATLKFASLGVPDVVILKTSCSSSDGNFKNDGIFVLVFLDAVQEIEHQGIDVIKT